MLIQLVSSIMASFILTRIEILSLQTDLDSCKIKCNSKKGHLPYIFEGRSFLGRLKLGAEAFLKHYAKDSSGTRTLHGESSFEVESILNIIYKNDTLDFEVFPIFKEHIFFQHRKSTGPNIDKDFRFFISAEYNFETKIWKSGYFEIDKKFWKDTKTTQHRFPILGPDFKIPTLRRKSNKYSMRSNHLLSLV